MLNKLLNELAIVKEYSLVFLIAVTFLAESVLYLGVLQTQEKLAVQNLCVLNKQDVCVIEKRETKKPKVGVIELIIQNTTQLSIMMLATTFFYLLWDILRLKMIPPKKPAVNSEKKNNQKNDFAGVLTRLLIGSFGASTIPTGISLILCAFENKDYIKHLSGVEIYIAFAGISLMSIAVLSIYEEKGRIEQEIEKIKSSKDILSMVAEQNHK
ncbi:hypothetical protein [Candidatus Parabeggiatoa sp. HSG14]|uniref:hypothetical protein n=1 Tax=Candidatus Parabeggiatoa sp. HSG14 TaxID=3055593 RepID=UPI0025A70C27|nr:hypothetical protein [Thiotrichales bacterium HSG14]